MISDLKTRTLLTSILRNPMSVSATQISGIGRSAARALRAKGFGSVEKIAASDVRFPERGSRIWPHSGQGDDCRGEKVDCRDHEVSKSS
ncbi:MAG: helix-hairpin-helix domain-containing protein [Verrucomicrobia bacterium TMED71]|nr:MAG: helix-hairpin-helix domain-containing protein [Verrucomicrobia bacterium TMED71]